MANFNEAYRIMQKHEGGYVNDPDDSGGETYKGIARKFHDGWKGWGMIDRVKNERNFPKVLDSNIELQELVKEFYQTNFWNKIKGDLIENQEIANSIFDFGVNAGVRTSVKLAQKIAKTDIDGIIGKNSVRLINLVLPELFLAQFSLLKIKRYVDIVKKNDKNRKFFYGWIRRTIGDI